MQNGLSVLAFSVPNAESDKGQRRSYLEWTAMYNDFLDCERQAGKWMAMGSAGDDSPFILVYFILEKLDHHIITSPMSTDYESRIGPNLSPD